MSLFLAIDLKSFYASVECIERGLDPLDTNLVVADESRTDKTICLAVSPSLKEHGISGRARLFEAKQRIKEVNAKRKHECINHRFIGKSIFKHELDKLNNLEVDFIAAKPRMALYMEYSVRIYNVYLKYIAPEDINVYSIDEVFIDCTSYLNTYKMSAKELCSTIIQDIYKTTGITATGGIGTNLYLAKIAMDIMAKHAEPDEAGVRIAYLDEKKYKDELWEHKPITDFWRVGRGIAKRLAEEKIYTMGDVALTAYENEDLLYKLLGINAELLIDHAYGYEPVTIKDIKGYKPSSSSISRGQVLDRPYTASQTRLVVKEMVDQLCLELIDKKLITDQIVLTLGYDIVDIKDGYQGEVALDRYGRKTPKHAHGTGNLDSYTSSVSKIMEVTLKLFDRIVDPGLHTRRIYINANHLLSEESYKEELQFSEVSLFEDPELQEKKRIEEKKKLEKERKLQEASLIIKNKYGKNALLKGMNLEDGATQKTRNASIGGHKA